MSAIHLRNVRVHNLRGINVAIPLGALTVVTGVSGAGKSSLVFDTLHAEAQRRFLQSFSTATRQYLERLERPDAEFVGDLPPTVAVRADDRLADPRTTVGSLTEIEDYLRWLLTRAGQVICPRCQHPVRAAHTEDVLTWLRSLPTGTKVSLGFASSPEANQPLSAWAAGLVAEGFLRAQIGDQVVRLEGEELPTALPEDFAWVLVDRLTTSLELAPRVTDSVETTFQRGAGRMAALQEGSSKVFDRRLVCATCQTSFQDPQPRLFDSNDPLGRCEVCQGTGGLGGKAGSCAGCQGSGRNASSLSVRLNGRNIAELGELELGDLRGVFAEEGMKTLAASSTEIQVLLDQVRRRLDLLVELDLGYLTLERAGVSLSSSELRRVRLTKALAANLAQAMYLFDEPSRGLHPGEVGKVLALLRRLKEAGNTVVVVDHHLDLVRAADHVIDLGPGAGEEGGQVLYQGPPQQLQDVEESLTGGYLSGQLRMEPPTRRRTPTGFLKLVGANVHNLRNLTLEFPLGVLCVVTGVSGAGKSSLLEECLYFALLQNKGKAKGQSAKVGAEVKGAGQVEEVVLVDAAPLPQTARSNPATYLKIFDEIRDLFAATADAKIRNFGPGAFSFNQAGGRCETCEGQGTLQVDMQFLADVNVPCPDCGGTRYRAEILAIKVRGLSIAQTLELTTREAFRFFRTQAKIERKLKRLLDVGLDYLRLGQPLETLSGGESQRLKLAAHLASSRKPNCLFILIEPSAGLHLADVADLLSCFSSLLEAGHSLILLENLAEIVRIADYLIELGPGAGKEGGRVVGLGTPEEVGQTLGSTIRHWLPPP